MNKIKVIPADKGLHGTRRTSIYDADSGEVIGEILDGFKGRMIIKHYFNVVDLRADSPSFGQTVNTFEIPTFNAAKAVAEYHFSLPYKAVEKTEFKPKI